jgi:CRP-like cAMP-binding protein
VELTRLQEGAFFGEIAVITRFQRTSTVEAAGEATVLEISTEVIGGLIDEHPEVLKVLLKFFRDRLIDTLVETSELFAPYAKQDRKALARRFRFLEADPGTQFLTEGERADGLYILLSGDLDAGAVGELGPGDLFGETSLLTDEGAPYSVTARTKCWVLKLERRIFREVIMTHPVVLAYVSDVADQRREQLQQLKEQGPPPGPHLRVI